MPEQTFAEFLKNKYSSQVPEMQDIGFAEYITKRYGYLLPDDDEQEPTEEQRRVLVTKQQEQPSGGIPIPTYPGMAASPEMAGKLFEGATESAKGMLGLRATLDPQNIAKYLGESQGTPMIGQGAGIGLGERIERQARPFATAIPVGMYQSWKEMLSDPVTFIQEKPFDFAMNMIDAAGAVGAVAGLAKKVLIHGGRAVTGAGLKTIASQLPDDALTAEARVAINSLDDAKIFKIKSEKKFGAFESPATKEGMFNYPESFRGDPYITKIIDDIEKKVTPSIKTVQPLEGSMIGVSEKVDDIVTETGGLTKKKIFTPEESSADEILEESRRASAGEPLKYPGDINEMQTAGGDVSKILKNIGVKPTRYSKLFDNFHSPDIVLGRHPVGAEIYETFNMADLMKNAWVTKEHRAFREAFKGIKQDSSLDVGIFKSVDTDFTLTDIMRMSPEEAFDIGMSSVELNALKRNPVVAKQAYDYLKESLPRYLRTYGKAALNDSALEAKIYRLAKSRSKTAKEFYESLTKDQKKIFKLYSQERIDYIPHIFSKDDVLDVLKKEAEILNEEISHRFGVKGVEKELSDLMEKRRLVLDSLVKIDKMPVDQTILKNHIPRNVYNRFLNNRRRGASGYQTSAIRAYNTYLSGVSRNIFDEPALRMADTLYKQLPGDMKPYAEWYVREFAGLNKKDQRLQRIYGNVKSMMWMKALGLNPRSAIVNLTQRLNIIASSGPKATLEGWLWSWTDEGKAAFQKSGLAETIPSVLMEGGAGPGAADILEKLRDITGFMFSAAERGNLKHAFSVGYRRAIKLGKHADEAMEAGIKEAGKTQFRYGKVGTPRSLRGAGGVIFQFWSYPIKQLEFLSKIYKENPLKLLGYVALSEGTKGGLDEFLGIDLSNALGSGIHWGDMFEMLDSLGIAQPNAPTKDVDLPRAKFKSEMVKRGFLEGGFLPYDLGPFAGLAAKAISILFGGDPKDLIEEIKPTFYRKIIDAKQAIMEGKDEEGKYTIRSQKTGYPLHKETPLQLLSREVIATPSVEKRSRHETLEDRMSDKMYQGIYRRIVRLIVSGDEMKAEQLMEKYGIEPTNTAINNEIDRMHLTPSERRKVADSQILFRSKIGLEQ